MKSRIESNSQPIDWSHSRNRILNDNFCILEQLKCSNNFRDWSKSMGGGGVGRSREGVGHEVLSLVQGVGRAIFSYP